jgi:hypothetical protein
MPPLPENDLYMMVGEIRSDVKKLLENDTTTQQRVGSLEKKFWIAVGATGFLGAMVTPAVAKLFGFF